MKLKLDENLPAKAAIGLESAGHDVETIVSQKMMSAADQEVIETCRIEGRALVTMDLDFTNPLRFPPHEYPGIAVLRLPARAGRAGLIKTIETLTGALEKESLTGRLWIVQIGSIREYQPEDN